MSYFVHQLNYTYYDEISLPLFYERELVIEFIKSYIKLSVQKWTFLTLFALVQFIEIYKNILLQSRTKEVHSIPHETKPSQM